MQFLHFLYFGWIFYKNNKSEQKNAYVEKRLDRGSDLVVEFVVRDPHHID